MTDTQKDMQTHRGTVKGLIIHEVQDIRRWNIVHIHLDCTLLMTPVVGVVLLDVDGACWLIAYIEYIE